MPLPCRRGKGYTKGPVKAWAVTTWFKQAARRPGLEDAHLHDLRHTCGTWMAARGVSERVIQEVLRHASITTTQIYTKAWPAWPTSTGPCPAAWYHKSSTPIF